MTHQFCTLCPHRQYTLPTANLGLIPLWFTLRFQRHSPPKPLSPPWSIHTVVYLQTLKFQVRVNSFSPSLFRASGCCSFNCHCQGPALFNPVVIILSHDMPKPPESCPSQHFLNVKYHQAVSELITYFQKIGSDEQSSKYRHDFRILLQKRIHIL